MKNPFEFPSTLLCGECAYPLMAVRSPNSRGDVERDAVLHDARYVNFCCATMSCAQHGKKLRVDLTRRSITQEA